MHLSTASSIRSSVKRRPSQPHFTRATAIVMLLVLMMSVATVERTSIEAPGGLRFGVLSSSCDARRAAAERSAGVQVVVVAARWSSAEPSPGEYDATYLANLADRIAICKQAGLQVIFSPGLHYSPAWVADLPSGTFRDQYGNVGPSTLANLVFSDAARRAAAQYLRQLSVAVPFSNFIGVRVGNSEAGELGYPGQANPADQTQRNYYWAFDSAAQAGTDLALGAQQSPMPGWVPGSRSWNGKRVSDAQVRDWFDWYAYSLIHSVLWQVELVRGLGYSGDFHVLLPGRGVLPSDLTKAVRARLDGTTAGDMSLHRGRYYPDQLDALAAAIRNNINVQIDRVIIDVTGVDDSATVSSRQRIPPQDGCKPSDSKIDLQTDLNVRHWSSFRWTTAIARQSGLAVIGENPGSPTRAGTGGSSNSDTLAEQLVYAPRYAAQCGLSLFLFAFEDDLFDGSFGVTLDQYAGQIQRYHH